MSETKKKKNIVDKPVYEEYLKRDKGYTEKHTKQWLDSVK